MENIEDAANRKRKIRIIATTCVLAVAILGVGAMVIISMITRIGDSKNANNNNTTATVATTEQKSEEAQKVEETKPTDNTKTSSTSATKKSETTTNTNNSTSTNTSVNTSAEASEVPSTGPADFIPTALLIGVAVYLVGINLNLKNRPQNA